MHLLLIHQAFVAPDEPGGTRHYELARHLVQRGHRCTIITADLSYLTGAPISGKRRLVTEQNLEGIRILRAYTYHSLHRSFVWRVVSFLSFMLTSVIAAFRAGQVDVVMGTTPPIFQAVSALLVAGVRRRPFLLEVRDLWPEFAIDMGVLRNPLLINLSRGLERFLYARATRILVNSPAYREYLIDKGLAAHRISFVANGVDCSMFDPLADGQAMRQIWNLNDKFVITYAGALGMANDISTVLQAADLLRDNSRIHFVLVGDGKERPHLMAEAERLNLPNVTFAGAYPKSRMPEVLSASDACLAILKDIPMFRTTYPNKVFDYMAAGRPTILVIDGVIRDVIEAAQGGIFVKPGDARALADVALRLAEEPELATAMGLSARGYVLEHFDRGRQAEAFATLISNLVPV